MGNTPPSLPPDRHAILKSLYRITSDEITCIEAALPTLTPSAITATMFPTMTQQFHQAFVAAAFPTSEDVSEYVSKDAEPACHSATFLDQTVALYSYILRPTRSPFHKHNPTSLIDLLLLAEPTPTAFFTTISTLLSTTFPPTYKPLDLLTSYIAFHPPLSPPLPTPDAILLYIDTTLPHLHHALATPLPLPGLRPSPPPTPPINPPPSSLPHLPFLTLSLPPLLTNTIKPLYSTSQSGYSFNRFLSCVQGYSSPVLIVMEFTGGPKSTIHTVTLALPGCSLTQQKDFHATPGALLFTTTPLLVIPSVSGTNHIYLNSSERIKQDDGLPHGLGIGGYANKKYPDGDFRIFIDEDFSTCSFKGSHFNGGSDGTFGEGKVVPDDWNGRGQLQAMTVLAYCDVAAGLAAKNDYNVGEAKRIAQARKVDKAQFLDDFKSGLFESTAFAHVEQVDKGRVGEDCRDDNPNGPA